MKKKGVDYIVESRRVQRRLPLRPVFAFVFSALFTVLIISGVQYVGERGKAEEEKQAEVIDGVETVVSDFVELDTISEGHRLEIPEAPAVNSDSGGASEIAPVGGTHIVYLTFDDGPGEHTARLLDVLGKYNVRATFFVTCKGSDDLIQREFNEGHTVALHTCSHNYNIYTDTGTYFNDLNAVSERVSRLTGKKSKIIRFPGGSSNTISAKYNKGIMSTLVSEVSNKGYKYFDWNVSSGDADSRVKTADVVYQNVVNGVNRRGNGSYSVVLQHDTKGFSVDAVERIIKYGLANGYDFRVLDENSPVTHHKVNN